MHAIGVICVLIGAIGAWRGPIDPGYAEDWVGFLFFVIMALLGFYMVVA